jgi:enolase
VQGLDVANQAAVDERLVSQDPTDQKTHLGGNALLGVSLATAHAAAAARRCPLYEHLHQVYALQAGQGRAGETPIAGPAMPLPMTNMISGGLHAGGNLDFQDILVLPNGAPDYTTGIEWIVRVYRRLSRLLQSAGYEGRLVGDEGGFGPRLPSNRSAVEFVVRAVESAGLRPGTDMVLAIDVAATHFFQDGAYRLASESNTRLTADQLIDLVSGWVDEFPIVSLEDALGEDDWSGWQRLTQRLGSRVQLVGDDLFTTNTARVRHGIQLGAANSVLIKVNQIGTLSEALETVHVARSAGYSIVVSARSGETEDTTIADLAVGIAAEQIKIGSIVRSERLAKYNQLLRIAERVSRGH